jgi:hypothetical protein
MRLTVLRRKNTRHCGRSAVSLGYLPMQTDDLDPDKDTDSIDDKPHQHWLCRCDYVARLGGHDE